MIEAGVTAGLTRDVSRDLVVGTLLGAARMMDETGQDPAELRAAVTSPGGTTAAAAAHARVQGGAVGVHRGGGRRRRALQTARGGDRRPTSAVFFLSDYGTADEFVGVVHAVLHRLAPDVPVIDLSHQVAPFDVAGGAADAGPLRPLTSAPGWCWRWSTRAWARRRRAVAVRTAAEQAGLDGPAWLVGPDNGLLLPMAAACGGVRSAIALVRGSGPFGASERLRPPATGADLRRPGRLRPGRRRTWPSGSTRRCSGPTVDPCVAGGGRRPRPRAGFRAEPAPGDPSVVTTVVSDRPVRERAAGGRSRRAGGHRPRPGDDLSVTVPAGPDGGPGDPVGGPDRSVPGPAGGGLRPAHGGRAGAAGRQQRPPGPGPRPGLGRRPPPSRRRGIRRGHRPGPHARPDGR